MVVDRGVSGLDDLRLTEPASHFVFVAGLENLLDCLVNSGVYRSLLYRSFMRGEE